MLIRSASPLSIALLAMVGELIRLVAHRGTGTEPESLSLRFGKVKADRWTDVDMVGTRLSRHRTSVPMMLTLASSNVIARSVISSKLEPSVMRSIMDRRNINMKSLLTALRVSCTMLVEILIRLLEILPY